MASSMYLSPIYANSSLLKAYNFDEVILCNLGQELKESNAQLRNLEKCVLTVSITALNIALIDNDTFLSDYIINFYSRNITKLNQKSTPFQISPLHLAIIFDRLNLAEQMLKAGVNPNLQDIRGWTPILHAAVTGNQRAIEMLIKFEADEKAMTAENGTYQDILRLTNLHKPVEDTLTSVFTLNETDSLPLSYKNYKLLTGSEYTSELFIDREVMIGNWKQPPEPVDTFVTETVCPDLRSKYFQYRKQPLPPILLTTVTHDSAGNSVDPCVGLGAYAVRSYKAGDIVMEFVGHISNTPEDNKYSLGNVNPKFIGNPASRANQGFPNMALLPLINILGAATRGIFIAIEDIHARSQFCWDYGTSNINEFAYTELRPRQAQEFINSLDGFKNANLFIEQINKWRLDSYSESHRKWAQSKYLQRNFSVLFALLLDKSVSQPKVQLMLEVAYINRKNYTGTPELPEFAYGNLYRIANLVVEVCNKLARFDQGISSEYFLFCQNLPKRMPFRYSIVQIEDTSKKLLAAETLTKFKATFKEQVEYTEETERYWKNSKK